MADNLLGGLGSILGGGIGEALSGFMPQDAPETQLFKASTDLSKLQKQEQDIFAEIGRQAYEQDPDAWPQADKLRLIQSNIKEAQQTLDGAKAAQEQAEAEKAASEAAATCPSCGYMNAEGIKFCQECGAKLGVATAAYCISCGATLAPGTRFCGECGTNQGA